MLKAEKINKVFRQGGIDFHAVSDADLSIRRGERVYIHGPSGAGKSTLLQVLGGLSKPTSGIVDVSEKDIYRFSDKKRSNLRNTKFGFIFQFYYLLPELTVLENVMLPAMIKGKRKKKDIKAKAVEILDAVKMLGRIGHRPGQLSGGEAQRVAISRALINDPEILFCDEPTGNLDSKMSDEIYRILHEISVKRDMSILLVSHQETTEGFADSEYFMKDGVIERIVSRENGGTPVHQSTSHL